MGIFGGAKKQQSPHAKGTIENCPCPFCHQPNNLSDAKEMVERGNNFECDHCHRIVWIIQVRPITVLLVSQLEPQMADALLGRR